MRSTKKGHSGKASSKKTRTKKTAISMKTTSPTATDQVLNVVKRFKKGVDVATLKQRTGFEDKKVRNILYRTVNQGKIKRVGRGLYARAS